MLPLPYPLNTQFQHHLADTCHQQKQQRSDLFVLGLHKIILQSL